MSLHRIDHAIVMDTDDIPGRGGYAVVGISAGVKPAERSFIAGNFGISDYLHDPKTENRIFYTVFRVPGGRRAFVRRFARGDELRRNNTQRRLVVHTLLLDDEVWDRLYALPWLLLNAKVRLEGAKEWDRLRAEVPWTDDGSMLPALEWDSEDGSVASVSQKIVSRLSVIGSQLGDRAPEPRELLARVITALATRKRVALPLDPGYEWVTMLAWSLLPRHDRDELAWTQHDSLNLSGVTFALSNAVGAAFDPAQVQPAPFAAELVAMNVESESSWLDLQGRTSRHPLSVRNPADLEKWGKWRNALLRLHENIAAQDVVAYMRRLAATVEANPRAPWIDAEEVLRLIWQNVPDAVRRRETPESAVMTWAERLRESGLADVVFRAAPTQRWLKAAAADVGADPLLSFFLSGNVEDAAAHPTRAALAEWLIETRLDGAKEERVVTLAQLLAEDASPSLQPLLALLLETRTGLAALIDALGRRERGGTELMHAAAPIVVRKTLPNTLEFLRDVFVPRFERNRVDLELARDIANALRDDSETFLLFVRRVDPAIAAELVNRVRQSVAADDRSRRLARDLLLHFKTRDGSLESALPLAIALAQEGEPAQVWFEVLLRSACSIDVRSDPGASRDFATMLRALHANELNLTGAMPLFVQLAAAERVYAHDAMRAVIALLRPAWTTGGTPFVNALIGFLGRALLVTSWADIVVAYAGESAAKHDDVSDLASAFWCKVDASQVEMLGPQTGALLDRIHGNGLRRLAEHWARKVGSLPRSSPVVEKLLALVQRNSDSYEVERDLARRELRQGDATPSTFNRLEAALATLHGAKATQLFAAEVNDALAEDEPAVRAVRVLKLFASEELHPTVRLALKVHVLPATLKPLKRRHWNDVLADTSEKDVLGLGVVPRLAYAVGAHASRGTAAHFERIWTAHRRRDALDALHAGRATRGFVQWLDRMMGAPDSSMLAQ